MSDKNTQYIHSLTDYFSKYENPENSIPMKRYMKNRFEFYGMKSPERKIITRDFIKNHGRPSGLDVSDFLQKLWGQPYRELHYFGLDVLEYYVKIQQISDVDLFRFLITTKSWWDTVDWLATRIVGVHLKNHPDEIDFVHRSWMDSNNMWLQRVCILFQLKYKQNTDLKLLFKTIEKLKDSDEFFIQKAIGWALREYSKTDPEIVIRFVKNHSLKPLSHREALKVINI